MSVKGNKVGKLGKLAMRKFQNFKGNSKHMF